jgi:hypothetical protein
MHAEDFIKKQQKYTRQACDDMASRQYKNDRFGSAVARLLIRCDGGKAQAIL